MRGGCDGGVERVEIAVLGVTTRVSGGSGRVGAALGELGARGIACKNEVAGFERLRSRGDHTGS